MTSVFCVGETPLGLPGIRDSDGGSPPTFTLVLGERWTWYFSGGVGSVSGPTKRPSTTFRFPIARGLSRGFFDLPVSLDHGRLLSVDPRLSTGDPSRHTHRGWTSRVLPLGKGDSSLGR